MINSFSQVVKHLPQQPSTQRKTESSSKLGPVDSYTKEQLYQMLQELERKSQQQSARRARESLMPLSEITHREANLSALVENTSEFILSLNKDFEILVINSAFTSFIEKQYEVSMTQGINFLTSLPLEGQQRWKPFLAKVIKGDAIKFTESMLKEEDEGYIEFSLNPTHSIHGEISGVSLFGMDITEREIRQEEVHQKMLLLTSINKSIKEGIFRTSPSEGIIYVNQAFADMFGYDSIEEVLQLDAYDLYVTPKRRDDFVQIMQKDTFFTNEEVVFKRKDGSTFWGLMSSIKVTDRGKVYHDGAIRDVTKIKDAENSLKARNQELIKVNQELDSFVYSTSHDLRAPLASILGLINITRLSDKEDDRQKYLGLMEQSINKLEGFIRDIIGYSRNSRIDLKREVINFKAMIDGCFRYLNFLDGSEKIKYEVSVIGEGPFYSDQTRLEMIFNNMISNAIRYCDPSKSECYIHVRIELAAETAFIEIEDNGIGIDEKYIDKIFDMFYRATQASQGSGIGLYIVREAVNKLGGIIVVQSQAGVGTTFRLEIPQLRIHSQQVVPQVVA